MNQATITARSPTPGDIYTARNLSETLAWSHTVPDTAYASIWSYMATYEKILDFEVWDYIRMASNGKNDSGPSARMYHEVPIAMARSEEAFRWPHGLLSFSSETEEYS